VRRDRIPACTFTEPQIGSVGLTETQAKEKGYEVKVGRFPFAGNSKATILGSHDGFVKVVSDARYGEILGVHILGPAATDLIAEGVAGKVAKGGLLVPGWGNQPGLRGSLGKRRAAPPCQNAITWPVWCLG